MATSSSSTAPLEAPEQSPKAKRRIHVSLTSIRTQGDRYDEMFRIYGLKVNKRNDSKKKTISTVRKKPKMTLTYSNGIMVTKLTNPEPWDPDWICKPRETDSLIAIIAYLEVEGGQLSPNQKRVKKASGLDLTRCRLPSAFFVPAYDELSDASDSDYENTDDWV